jgi:hypothetical protein
METTPAPEASNQSNRPLLSFGAIDLLRQRSLSARYEKARRGELVVSTPVGFVKAGDHYEKDPDRRVAR